MNLDVIVLVALVALLSGLIWLVWRALRGRAANGRRQALRIIVAVVISLLAVSTLAYRLMNSRTVQVLGDHMARVDTQRKVVAITFDDGPDDALVDGLVADLRRYDARGTFYVVGTNAEEHPDAVRSLVSAGHELGNHTYDHPRLVFVSTGTAESQIARADAAIRAAGYDGPLTVRPPFAKKLLSLPYVLWRDGRMAVMWDVEPDSIAGISADPEAMTRHVIDNVRPGSIVLLHPWGNAATRQALPMILAALSDRGYEFLTVSELLA